MKITPPLMFFSVAIFLLLIPNASSISTCVNTTDDREICFDIDSGIYPQNIDLWEGQNENYGLHIINPDDISNQNLFSKIKTSIKNLFDSNKIDVTQLDDETTFEFQSFDDFYNFLQQQNAEGNISLFTSKDLNGKERIETRKLTSGVLTWTKILMIVIIEFFKIMLNIILLIGSTYLFFRIIPFALNQTKKLVYKLIVRQNDK